MGLQRAIESGQLTKPAGGERSLLSFNELTLSADQQAELVERLQALIDEFDERGDETEGAVGERFTLFAAAFAVVD